MNILSGKQRKMAGFTIVELLIVIVVIAILAAITIVSYNGIQQRANNTVKIATVNQLIKLIDMYTTMYDAYPATNSTCATVDNLCTNSSGEPQASPVANATLMTELRKVGTPPQSLQPAVAGNYGVMYVYEPASMFNGNASPVRLVYSLDGVNTACGVKSVSNSNATNASTSTTGYTTSTSNPNRTLCWIRLGIGI